MSNKTTVGVMYL